VKTVISEDWSDYLVLQVLGSLEQRDKILLDSALAESADLQAELMDLQEAVAALVYAAPSVPLSADLKDRLFQQIARSDVLQKSDLYHLFSLSLQRLIQQAEGLDWQPMPGSDTAATMATLEIDRAHDQIAFYVQAGSAGKFPAHWHAAGEEVLVLQGDFVVDGQIYGPGERIYSRADTTHQPETLQGCLLLCLSSLHDETIFGLPEDLKQLDR
jgi:putative transcriptional regulator